MKILFQSLKITIALSVFLFVGYVLVLWGFGSIVEPNHGEAEVSTQKGKIVGATHVGQGFQKTTYFWSRPSAVAYHGDGSGGSNKGATNPHYLTEVKKRINAFLLAHPYLKRAQVPSEMVTASGSGLDPHLSPEAVAVQVKRVAMARGISEQTVAKIVAANTERPLLGKTVINVLQLNLALDEIKN
ncbi:MAG: potassium-transporting ATPase subunit C [Bacteroidaceae bacterium]